jgi:hypothetical protein
MLVKFASVSRLPVEAVLHAKFSCSMIRQQLGPEYARVRENTHTHEGLEKDRNIISHLFGPVVWYCSTYLYCHGMW